MSKDYYFLGQIYNYLLFSNIKKIERFFDKINYLFKSFFKPVELKHELRDDKLEFVLKSSR